MYLEYVAKYVKVEFHENDKKAYLKAEGNLTAWYQDHNLNFIETGEMINFGWNAGEELFTSLCQPPS